MTPPATSNSSLASDPAVLVEGLGSLSLSPIAVAEPELKVCVVISNQ
jgi:hypothetical protein